MTRCLSLNLMPVGAPAITLVIPVFNEEAVLPELFERLARLFDANPAEKWTAVLVNDGSRDRSVELIRTKSATDARFVLVELSRNFGFQAAISAGLAEATGRNSNAVVTMDADLQDPPELIPDMVAKWREGAEVVLAVRRSRQETGLRRVGMDLFHRLFGAVADMRMDRDTGTFSLLDRMAVAAVCQMPERNRFFPGLRSWVGFRTGQVSYDRQERAAGQPQQTLMRLLRYALDGVFSFSYLPLRMLTYSGVFIALMGFAAAVFYTIRRLLDVETAPTGYTTLVTLVLFLGGVQLIGIGVLGEYLARVYDEVKQRPPYIVRPPHAE
jgi:polyisoprenyl-phosphate glycosyltransferase